MVVGFEERLKALEAQVNKGHEDDSHTIPLRGSTYDFSNSSLPAGNGQHSQSPDDILIAGQDRQGPRRISTIEDSSTSSDNRGRRNPMTIKLTEGEDDSAFFGKKSGKL